MRSIRLSAGNESRDSRGKIRPCGKRPDIVALLIVAVDQQGHAVTASQQLIGGSQCHTRLDIAGIDNEAVEAVVTEVTVAP